VLRFITGVHSVVHSALTLGLQKPEGYLVLPSFAAESPVRTGSLNLLAPVIARQDGLLRCVVVPANLAVARQDGLLRYVVDSAVLVGARPDGRFL